MSPLLSASLPSSAVKHAIGMMTGTCSVEMILKSIDVRNATVLLPSHTFVATATAAVTAGARLIFVDCQPENFQMDPDDLERSIQSDSKVVILVHMAGIISPHLERIKKICRDHDLLLMEDAAHAHGATIDGKKAGSLGVAGSFSFFSTKVMTTGEGGMVTTSSDEIDKSCRAYRDHGRFTKDPNYTEEIGRNARPSEIHALLGLRQMASIDKMLAERRQIAKWYDDKIGDDRIPFVTRLKIPSNIQSAYYKYVLYLDERIDRQDLRKCLKEGFGVSLSANSMRALSIHSPFSRSTPNWLRVRLPRSFPQPITRLRGISAFHCIWVLPKRRLITSFSRSRKPSRPAPDE